MKQAQVKALMQLTPVIPVVVIEERAQAVPLAKALLEGGVKVIEVTLRTDAALDAIADIAGQVPEMMVGAGTVLGAEDYAKAVTAGAKFIVSPGAEAGVLDVDAKSGVPLLPGAVTPSEIMALRARGYHHLKFFPAESYGGIKTLKSLGGPFQDVYFCPTGGISAGKAEAYLELDNVLCLGASWVTPAASLESSDWSGITELARATRSV